MSLGQRLPRSRAQPFTNATVRALEREEIAEMPEFLRENAERVHEFAEPLFCEFGPGLRIEVVGLESPKGLWLGLRHKIGKGFAVVVDGREVIRGPSSYEPIRQAVARAVQSRSAPGR